MSESTASAIRMERFVRPTTFERLLLILLYGYDGNKFFSHRSGGSYSVPIGTIVMYSTCCIALRCIVLSSHHGPIVTVVIITFLGSRPKGLLRVEPKRSTGERIISIGTCVHPSFGDPLSDNREWL